MTLGPRQVRDLLERHGLRPSRALGQNFVADANTVRRIAALAGVGPGDRVVEIGAGLGSLTLALAETGAAVTAIEVDRHLVPLLREVVEPVGVRVVHGDARTVDWAALLADSPATSATADVDDPGAEPGGVERPPAGRGPHVLVDAAAGGAQPWALVANLPYNIATLLVLDLLEKVPAVERMLVMVQREVADRLAAGVGDPAYGIPSVKAAWWADADLVGRVPPTVFVPQPRVESALVRLVRHHRWDTDAGIDSPATSATAEVDSPATSATAEVDRRTVFRLVDAGFGQRRKMLRRSLAGLVEARELEAAGICPEARAEELALADWARLAVVVGGRMPD